MKVELISKGNDNSLVKITYNNKKELCSNSNIFDNYEEAKLSKREYNIARNFKRKHSSKGVMTCTHCGKKGKDLTVDHIKSLKQHGGKREIRKDLHKWEECWNEDNLQILCSSCNKIKNTMSQSKFERYINKIDKKAKCMCNKKNKKMALGSTQYFKASFGLGTSKYNKKNINYSYEVLERMAKMDSRTIYLNL